MDRFWPGNCLLPTVYYQSLPVYDKTRTGVARKVFGNLNGNLALSWRPSGCSVALSHWIDQFAVCCISWQVACVMSWVECLWWVGINPSPWPHCCKANTREKNICPKIRFLPKCLNTVIAISLHQFIFRSRKNLTESLDWAPPHTWGQGRCQDSQNDPANSDLPATKPRSPVLL